MNLPTAAVKFIPWEGVTPGQAFAALESRPGVFWLDSSSQASAGARYSIMGCAPFARFRSWGERFCFACDGAAAEFGRGDPLAAFEGRLRQFRVAPTPDTAPPFCGGAVGLMAYELGRIIEPAAGTGAEVVDAPDLNFAWHDAAVIWDHVLHRAWIAGAGWRRSPDAAIGELAGWLGTAGRADAVEPAAAPAAQFTGNMTRSGFMDAVERVRERIAVGEIYQMNLAQRFDGVLTESPAALYRRLRRLNPAPMAAYFDAGENFVVLSSSPERFIEVEGAMIRTFPIKGTRPRGRTPEEDAAECARLLGSEKERAELLMIVDLLRNDLGRVCRYGSVRVRRLHALESFATVHHLVGEVEGELRADVGVAALLRAVFPGGSITGAPKVRAMQVIGEIEPGPRGVFSGCIGYFSACGRIDLNIAIRTIVCRGSQAGFHVGAGIVWDSDPAAEYEETLAKGRALFAALGVREGTGP